MNIMRSRLILLVLIFVLAFPASVLAEMPYNGYNYDEWRQSVSSPNGYLPDKTYTGKELGVGNFNNPQDIFVDKNENIYVLDSGNKRIVVFNSDMQVLNIINKFYTDKGEEKLKEPKGLFVNKEGTIFITDREGGKVYAINNSGKIIKTYLKPVSDIISKDFSFLPEKVIEDSSKTLYVLASGIYQGAISYDMDGNFTGFYGSNKVQASGDVIKDMFWKKFMTKEQRSKMKRYIPIQYSNFDIDEEDFVYTCTSTSPSSLGEIRKLNALSTNILKARGSTKDDAPADFGDQGASMFKGKYIDTTFVDIKVDEDGFIFGLDSARGRIFQYDQECNLIFAFGGRGAQVGTFDSPVAIESVNGRILVLDSKKNNITAFQITKFGESVQKAVKMYNEGLYDEAVEPWKEVLRRDENYRMAYIGIGKALLNAGEYKEAMSYFKLGYDKKGYSDAFKEYRTIVMRENFSLIMLGLILLLLLPYILKKVKLTFQKRFIKRGDRRAA